MPRLAKRGPQAQLLKPAHQVRVVQRLAIRPQQGGRIGQIDNSFRQQLVQDQVFAGEYVDYFQVARAIPPMSTMGIFRGVRASQTCRSVRSMDSGGWGAVTTLKLLHKMNDHTVVLLHLPGVPAAIGRTQIAVRADFAA